mgnify:CR=1 FL=1
MAYESRLELSACLMLVHLREIKLVVIELFAEIGPQSGLSGSQNFTNVSVFAIIADQIRV